MKTIGTICPTNGSRPRWREFFRKRLNSGSVKSLQILVIKSAFSLSEIRRAISCADISNSPYGRKLFVVQEMVALDARDKHRLRFLVVLAVRYLAQPAGSQSLFLVEFAFHGSRSSILRSSTIGRSIMSFGMKCLVLEPAGIDRMDLKAFW